MNRPHDERWGAATGYLVFILGIAAAFPPWLVWLAAVTALLNLVMAFGIVVDSGPLVMGAMLTYMLYALMAVWQIAVTTVLVMRLRHPPAPVLPGAREPLKG